MLWHSTVLSNPSCKLYESKHSAEILPDQARHLLDAAKCKMIEHRYSW